MRDQQPSTVGAVQSTENDGIQHVAHGPYEGGGPAAAVAKVTQPAFPRADVHAVALSAEAHIGVLAGCVVEGSPRRARRERFRTGTSSPIPLLSPSGRSVKRQPPQPAAEQRTAGRKVHECLVSVRQARGSWPNVLKPALTALHAHREVSQLQARRARRQSRQCSSAGAEASLGAAPRRGGLERAIHLGIARNTAGRRRGRAPPLHETQQHPAIRSCDAEKPKAAADRRRHDR